MSRSLRSCVFATQDQKLWMLELRAEKPHFNALLAVHAIESEEERALFEPRKLLVQPLLQKHIESKS